MAKVEDHNWETIFYGHHSSAFNHCDVISQRNNRFRSKTQKKAISRSRSFKVIEFGINRRPVCDFLLDIHSNLHPISYCFGVIADHWSLFKFWTLRFWATLCRLRDNVQCSAWAQWKGRSGLPISVNWTFSLVVTAAESLRANVGSISAISLQRRPVDPKISGRRSPRQPFFF